jgi:hypothetical protein
MAYDDADYVIRHETRVNNITGIASTMMARVLFFQTARLKKVHAVAITAGTNAAAGVDILVGTTSVGALTFGTDTAGTTYSSSVLNTTIPALGIVEIKGKATSATMVHSYCIEYEVTPDAVQS